MMGSMDVRSAILRERDVFLAPRASPASSSNDFDWALLAVSCCYNHSHKEMDFALINVQYLPREVCVVACRMPYLNITALLLYSFCIVIE